MTYAIHNIVGNDRLFAQKFTAFCYDESVSLDCSNFERFDVEAKTQSGKSYAKAVKACFDWINAKMMERCVQEGRKEPFIVDIQIHKIAMEAMYSPSLNSVNRIKWPKPTKAAK